MQVLKNSFPEKLKEDEIAEKLLFFIQLYGRQNFKHCLRLGNI